VDDREGGYCAETEAEAKDKHRDSLGGSAPDFRDYDQPNVYNGGDLDCEDFNAKAEAQAYLEANRGDADYLDGDGVACEWGT
jgi:hypothetical protein